MGRPWGFHPNFTQNQKAHPMCPRLLRKTSNLVRGCKPTALVELRCHAEPCGVLPRPCVPGRSCQPNADRYGLSVFAKLLWCELTLSFPTPNLLWLAVASRRGSRKQRALAGMGLPSCLRYRLLRIGTSPSAKGEEKRRRPRSVFMVLGSQPSPQLFRLVLVVSIQPTKS